MLLVHSVASAMEMHVQEVTCVVTTFALSRILASMASSVVLAHQAPMIAIRHDTLAHQSHCNALRRNVAFATKRTVKRAAGAAKMEAAMLVYDVMTHVTALSTMNTRAQPVRLVASARRTRRATRTCVARNSPPRPFA